MNLKWETRIPKFCCYFKQKVSAPEGMKLGTGSGISLFMIAIANNATN
jgi:hypothetical protein